MRLPLFLLLVFWLSGCAYLPSVKNRLMVVENGVDTFIVAVGWKRYSEITKTASNYHEEISLLANFAVSEVISRGLCNSAEVPNEHRKLLGWEGIGDRGIKVVCTSSL